ncbi:hypothetical protein [Deinococcus sp. ME38]|uniref:hypothetical protein n=1 Tax=Deinococcus sp. ME38 TaxID=3400344 RepID=UPI003B5BC301
MTEAALRVLHEVSFVVLVTEGKSIKSIIPTVPYFDELFTNLGSYSLAVGFEEPEILSMNMLDRLSDSPISKDLAYQIGNDRKLVDKVLDIGSKSSFIRQHRARGKTILVSPTYFPENPDAYADLVAKSGASRLKRVLEIISNNAGWPLKLALGNNEINGNYLSPEDVEVIKMLASEAMIPTPAVVAAHSGINHFLFGASPGQVRLPLYKKPIFEAALAILAAVRQGQLLSHNFPIFYPSALLKSFKAKKYLNTNTEAIHQYKEVVNLRIARLGSRNGNWSTLELIDTQENNEALDMAISMLDTGNIGTQAVDKDAVLALREGQEYLDTLIGSKRVGREFGKIAPDEETLEAIDSFMHGIA